jgi:hypothetical protein
LYITEIKIKKQFEASGYHFIALAALALLGFWPTYFSKFFNGTADFKFYFHFHATVITLWVALLITQPILIRRKQLKWHRLIGKFSYILIPLIFISVILVAHSRHSASEKNLDIQFFVPFKDLVILATAYSIAIINRHNIDLHARGMIVCGLVFIEPALSRFIDYAIAPFPTAYFLTISIVFSLLIVLIFLERNQKRGRWIFPMTLGLYIFMHAIILFEVHIAPWVTFSKWFAALPLT